MERPRVFEEGTITLVASPQGCSVYVGANEIRMFSAVELKFEEGDPSPTLILKLQRSHDQEVALKLDEENRLIQSLSWVNIRQ